MPPYFLSLQGLPSCGVPRLPCRAPLGPSSPRQHKREHFWRRLSSSSVCMCVCTSLDPASLQTPQGHGRASSSPWELHPPPPQTCDHQNPQERGQGSSRVTQPHREQGERDQRAAKGLMLPEVQTAVPGTIPLCITRSLCTHVCVCRGLFFPLPIISG